ncbi:hypothetical protein BRX37_03450 [Sphingomonas sp. S-NIH.Pt3_0716]|nr:hypothetical protein BRX37_03450 [Sphingomonas sp. S-NIH.Pt3_0716]
MASRLRSLHANRFPRSSRRSRAMVDYRARSNKRVNSAHPIKSAGRAGKRARSSHHWGKRCMISERRKLIPTWVVFTVKLPPSIRTIPARVVGAWRLLIGVTVYDRNQVLEIMANALRLPLPKTILTLLNAEINTARAHIEFAEFEAIPKHELVSWVANHTLIENIEALEESLEQRKSTLILSTSFASHYYGLVSPSTSPRIHKIAPKIVVLQPSIALEPLNAIGFYDRLETAGAVPIETIPADSPYSMIKAIKSMKRGGLGVARFDSLPTETGNFLLTEMFGMEVAFPASLLRMAQLSDAAILPLFIFRRGGKFVTRFGSPVLLTPDATTEHLTLAANSLSKQVEEEIRKRPNEYTAWHGFYEKVRIAREIRKLLVNDKKIS